MVMQEATQPLYVWTAKAEEQAKIKGIKHRKKGRAATYNGEYIRKYGSITKDWIKKGYIELKNDN